jgi:hypothetical protein
MPLLSRPAWPNHDEMVRLRSRHLIDKRQLSGSRKAPYIICAPRLVTSVVHEMSRPADAWRGSKLTIYTRDNPASHTNKGDTLVDDDGGCFVRIRDDDIDDGDNVSYSPRAQQRKAEGGHGEAHVNAVGKAGSWSCGVVF